MSKDATDRAATQSRRRNGRNKAQTAEIPDFTLALVLHSPQDDVDEAELLKSLFASEEIASGATAPQRLSEAQERLDKRRLAALAFPSGDLKSIQNAFRAARQAHAPVTVLAFGDAAIPPGAASSISFSGPLTLARRPLSCDKRSDHGPFDVIGDVHGCYEELVALLKELGWTTPPHRKGETLIHVKPPEGRRALFVGDLVDRGPRNVDVLRLVMGMVADGHAEAVRGNHDDKLLRLLNGANVKRSHGLAETEAELMTTSSAFRKRVATFLSEREKHLWLDDGTLVVAHAGLPEEMHGRTGKALRSFALFGDVTGERDEYGLPIRRDWAANYDGKAVVMYGHTPMRRAVWRNETICLDTGCCFGGALTAARWPERDLISVPAKDAYADAIRPLGEV